MRDPAACNASAARIARRPVPTKSTRVLEAPGRPASGNVESVIVNGRSGADRAGSFRKVALCKSVTPRTCFAVTGDTPNYRRTYGNPGYGPHHLCELGMRTDLDLELLQPRGRGGGTGHLQGRTQFRSTVTATER